MNGMIRFLHWAGFSIWLGAQLTFMVWGPVVRDAGLETWAHTWRTLGKVQRWVVAPAALVATVTGIILTMQLASQHFDVAGTTWLWGMQAFGVLAAVLALGIATPLANRMAWLAEQSVADGVRDPRAEAVRKKLAWAGSLSGVSILAALYFGAVGPALASAR